MNMQQYDIKTANSTEEITSLEVVGAVKKIPDE